PPRFRRHPYCVLVAAGFPVRRENGETTMLKNAILPAFLCLGLAACSTDAPVGVAQQPLKGQFCGGIAGFPCPTGYTCVDDPSDSCDPNAGGADCGGICVKDKTGG